MVKERWVYKQQGPLSISEQGMLLSHTPPLFFFFTFCFFPEQKDACKREWQQCMNFLPRKNQQQSTVCPSHIHQPIAWGTLQKLRWQTDFHPNVQMFCRYKPKFPQMWMCKRTLTLIHVSPTFPSHSSFIQTISTEVKCQKCHPNCCSSAGSTVSSVLTCLNYDLNKIGTLQDITWKVWVKSK